MKLPRPLSRVSKKFRYSNVFFYNPCTSLRFLKIIFLVICQEQVYCFLWERLPAAIVLIRGWKPLSQAFFLVSWTYRISAIIFSIAVKAFRLDFILRDHYYSYKTSANRQYWRIYHEAHDSK